MQKLLSLFNKPQVTLRHYRMEMRRSKEAMVIKQGREQFMALVKRGIRIPVALV